MGRYADQTLFKSKLRLRISVMPIKPMTDNSGEVRELTRQDLRAFRPASEVLLPELVALIIKHKRTQRDSRSASFPNVKGNN